MQDPFATRLRAWLVEQGRPAQRIDLLPGDVSPRRYARVIDSAGSTAIAAFYPESVRESMNRYRSSTHLFADADIRVPGILAAGQREGFMLVEDLGPATIFERAAHVSVSAMAVWFAQALPILHRIQTILPADVSPLNPALDGAWLARELEQTWDSFLLPRCLGGSRQEAQELRAALDRLCAALGKSRQAVCHRDFMARNLIPTDQGLAVIDHQDVRLGPAAYDLASLLNDSWFPPARLETQLLAEALVGQPGGVTRADYDRAAAQRTLKAVGTFARAGASGSAKHEELIAPAMDRALQCLARAPETHALAPALAARWRQHLLD